MFRAFSEDSLYINFFWIEARGGGIEILTMLGVKNVNFWLNQKIEQMFIPAVHAD